MDGSVINCENCKHYDDMGMRKSCLKGIMEVSLIGPAQMYDPLEGVLADVIELPKPPAKKPGRPRKNV